MNSETSKVKFMRKLAILFFCLLCVSAKAQFFYGFPPVQRGEQKEEKYTAPAYKKGEAGIRTFIQKNFQPGENRERVDGKIVVAVIVDAKGKPVETHIVRSLTKLRTTRKIHFCAKAHIHVGM